MLQNIWLTITWEIVFYDKVFSVYEVWVFNSQQNNYFTFQKISYRISNEKIIPVPSVHLYIENNTRPNITFSVNLLARYSCAPTWRHWYEVEHIFRYLRVTTNMRLFYCNKSKVILSGYPDAGYLSNPKKARLQISYLFTYEDITISWRLVK